MDKYFKCEICNGSKYTIIQDYKYKNKIFANIFIVECSKCKLKSAFPLPNEKELDFYNKNFFSNAYNITKKDKISEIFLDTIAKCRVDFINKHIPNPDKILDVLEIGPGKCHLYDNFKNEFNFKSYSAIETDNNLHSLLNDKKIKIFNSLNEITIQKFDLIILSHVLEHILFPGKFLDKIFSLLNNDGKIFIDIPCLDYKYKDFIDPHLYFYDKKTLELLLENNNFKVDKIHYFGKKITEIEKKPLHKNNFLKLCIFLLKINFEFLIKTKKSSSDLIFKNKKQIIMENIFEMNTRTSHKSMWIRCLATKI
jgi:SAM-dependent methyltransferase